MVCIIHFCIFICFIISLKIKNAKKYFLSCLGCWVTVSNFYRFLFLTFEFYTIFFLLFGHMSMNIHSIDYLNFVLTFPWLFNLGKDMSLTCKGFEPLISFLLWCYLSFSYFYGISKVNIPLPSVIGSNFNWEACGHDLRPSIGYVMIIWVL